VLGADWLGRGPARVYKNRMQGPWLDIWQRDKNDAITGQVWTYPEFKGYYSDLYWARLRTSEGAILFVIDTPDVFPTALHSRQRPFRPRPRPRSTHRRCFLSARHFPYGQQVLGRLRTWAAGPAECREQHHRGLDLPALRRHSAVAVLLHCRPILLRRHRPRAQAHLAVLGRRFPGARASSCWRTGSGGSAWPGARAGLLIAGRRLGFARFWCASR